MKKNIAIIVLGFLVVLLSSYIVVDKVISNKIQKETVTNNNLNSDFYIPDDFGSIFGDTWSDMFDDFFDENTDDFFENDNDSSDGYEYY